MYVINEQAQAHFITFIKEADAIKQLKCSLKYFDQTLQNLVQVSESKTVVA